jgi:hypothetical protein
MWLYCDWTRRLLREPRTWRAIQELAARLIQSGFVSGEDAETIFRAHKVPRARRIWLSAAYIKPSMKKVMAYGAGV